MSAGLPDETPDLVMGPLRIRVLRRQFPEAEDYWDANWLVVHAVVSTPRSRAEARGPLLHLGDLVAWREHLARIEPGRNADVELGATEPYGICNSKHRKPEKEPGDKTASDNKRY